METPDKERLQLNTQPEDRKEECLNIKTNENDELLTEKDTVSERWNSWIRIIRN